MKQNINIPILPEAFLTFASKSFGPSYVTNKPTKLARPGSQMKKKKKKKNKEEEEEEKEEEEGGGEHERTLLQFT